MGEVKRRVKSVTLHEKIRGRFFREPVPMDLMTISLCGQTFYLGQCVRVRTTEHKQIIGRIHAIPDADCVVLAMSKRRRQLVYVNQVVFAVEM